MTTAKPAELGSLKQAQSPQQRKSPTNGNQNDFFSELVSASRLRWFGHYTQFPSQGMAPTVSDTTRIVGPAARSKADGGNVGNAMRQLDELMSDSGAGVSTGGWGADLDISLPGAPASSGARHAVAPTRREAKPGAQGATKGLAKGDKAAKKVAVEVKQDDDVV